MFECVWAKHRVAVLGVVCRHGKGMKLLNKVTVLLPATTLFTYISQAISHEQVSRRN